jgi:hypothetical protein
MPFSRYQIDRYQIDPEHIEAMHSAFHRVCDALLLKGDVDDPMTEMIADKIMALAKAGEHDADRLAELVLNDLADDGQAGHTEGLGARPTSHNPRIEKTEHSPAR